MADKRMNIEINAEDEFGRAFGLFDKKDQGKITVNDLGIVADELYDPTDEANMNPLTNFGKLSDEELREMIYEIDRKRLGYVVIADFIHMLRKAKQIM